MKIHRLLSSLQNVLTKLSSSYTIWFQMTCWMMSCLNHDYLILIFIHFHFMKIHRLLSSLQIKMTFQEIRIIATGPCITNQLRDVSTICRRSWYIAAHIWTFIILKLKSSRLSLILVLSWPLSSNSRYKSKNDADEAVYVVSLISSKDLNNMYYSNV